MPDRRSPHRARHASPPGQVTRSPATAAGRGQRGNQDAPAGHAALRSNGLPAHTWAICVLSAGYFIQDRAARNRRMCRGPMKHHEESHREWRNSLLLVEALPERHESALNWQIRPTGHRTSRTGPPKSILPAQWPDLGSSPGICVPPHAKARPNSNACAASHAVPVAVLCCCTLDPAVRISLLTSGAKGTRTPDPLLANNRQAVHWRPSPQVTVPERVSASPWIRTCCGTFVLYSCNPQREGLGVPAPLVPGNARAGRSVCRHEYLGPT